MIEWESVVQRLRDMAATYRREVHRYNSNLPEANKWETAAIVLDGLAEALWFGIAAGKMKHTIRQVDTTPICGPNNRAD